MKEKDYIAVVQCHLVKQRCSGYFCEQAFHNREGEFTRYDKDKSIRSIYMTCGGCCGRAMHRKLGHLVHRLKNKEGIEKDRIIVHLSSCIAKDNYHSPECPHLDYLHTMIDRLGLDVVDGTRISEKAKKRREDGTYKG
ncbi:CGGC domain-containing protein [Candidatus Latescibacterota bacterium]